MKGNTHSWTTEYILPAGKSWKVLHLSCLPGTARSPIFTSSAKTLS